MLLYDDLYIDTAYAWLCKQRKDYHFKNDVWHLRFHWAQEKPRLVKALKEQRYALHPVHKIRTPDRVTFLWCALDALVLKALSLLLKDLLTPILSDRIYHLAGSPEQKKGYLAAITAVTDVLPRYPFVFRTDVKRYYASISHRVLMNLCRQYIACPYLISLVKGYVNHVIVEDGVYTAIKKGISLGCPLSPLMGALFLKPLDDALEKMEVFYIRFMDDWVVLATTRHRLRKAVRVVNQCLESLQVSQHPNKTFVGRTSKGFDFLGRHFQRYEISKGCMICVTPKKEEPQKTSVKPCQERPSKT